LFVLIKSNFKKIMVDQVMKNLSAYKSLGEDAATLE